TNYILLARIIEVIRDTSFEAYMKTELFEPLGMADTRVWNLLSTDSTFANKADDFRNFHGFTAPLKPGFLDGVAGDGAVFCSAYDFLIWDRFWEENELISAETLQQAFLPPTMHDGTVSDYGFGWVISDKGMWHNGGWLGARTYISRKPSVQTCMVVLDNSQNFLLDEIIEQLQKVELGRE
ncbi:MAG: serine hydrolase domain-containing protein, partial [Bacteroidota bacterium]